MFTPHHILRRTKAERLYTDPNTRLYLEDPQPVSQSLEWRLAERYWHHHGATPFSDGSVPYIVNNSGWAPRAAAEMVLTAGRVVEGPLVVVEIGAGSGLFAKQALDHIQEVSTQQELNIYDRLTWICTDGSALAVDKWRNREQFSCHKDHIVCQVLQAEDFNSLDTPQGTLIGVMINYALDSLPLEVVNTNGERLHLQSHICIEQSNLEQWLGLSFTEIQDCIQSSNPESLDALLPMLDFLEVTASFKSGVVPYADAALSAAQTDISMVNIGAIELLQAIHEPLCDGGFILINDYGPTTPEAFSNQHFIHRFGGTATGGINFLHLDGLFANLGSTVFIPNGDDHRTIHTRMYVRGQSEHFDTPFSKQYSDPRYVQSDRIGLWIRSYIGSGQYSEALELFERHLKWCPTDWFQLAQAAQLLMQQFGQVAEASELASEAVRLNPWSSTLVWNIYGSALFSNEDYDGATDAWNTAIEIHPEDPSTWLNFSYLYVLRDQKELALQAIAKGLAYDRNGQLRSALLHKQAEIIDAGLQFEVAKLDRSGRRHRTLVDAFKSVNKSE